MSRIASIAKRLLLAATLSAAPAMAQSTFTPDLSNLTPAAAAASASVKAPVCSIPAIPSGNNVVNTATETQFVSACRLPASMTAAGTGLRIDSRFLFGVATAPIPTLRGRVLLARTATPALASCVTALTCVVVLDTGPVAGLAAGANLYANADVSLTFPSSTQVEGAGQLNFQTTAAAVIAIGVNSAANTGAGPVTIPWDMATVDTWLVYTALWSTASNASYIQLRQQTIK